MRTVNCLAESDGQPGFRMLEKGFSLVEFMLSSLVLLVIAAAAFGVLSQTGRTADTQNETQIVTDNARTAMETLTRIIQQAGNNPLGGGFRGISITSATELHVRSDLTGSATPANPDKGDPDGDIADAGEDITIRYNAPAQTIELLTGPFTQMIASNVSAFSMRYFNRDGAATNLSDDVARVKITLTATSLLPDPQTRRIFSMQLSSDVQISARQ